MGFTPEQQTLLDNAKTQWQNAQVDYDNAIQLTINAQNAAQACQSARDQFTLGNKKNDACHIDTLGALNGQWAAKARDRDAKLVIRDQKKSAYDQLLASLGTESQTATDFTNSSPEQQQFIAELNARTDLQKSEYFSKNVKYIIIGGIIISILIIGFVIYKKRKFKK